MGKDLKFEKGRTVPLLDSTHQIPEHHHHNHQVSAPEKGLVYPIKLQALNFISVKENTYSDDQTSFPKYCTTVYRGRNWLFEMHFQALPPPSQCDNGGIPCYFFFSHTKLLPLSAALGTLESAAVLNVIELNNFKAL
jgi:hypothetical protein